MNDKFSLSTFTKVSFMHHLFIKLEMSPVSLWCQNSSWILYFILSRKIWTASVHPSLLIALFRERWTAIFADDTRKLTKACKLFSSIVLLAPGLGGPRMYHQCGNLKTLSSKRFLHNSVRSWKRGCSRRHWKKICRRSSFSQQNRQFDEVL